MENDTLYLEMTEGVGFKTPTFPCRDIYSRYRLDEKNPYNEWLKSLIMFLGALDLFHRYKSNLAHLLASQNLVIEF